MMKEMKGKERKDIIHWERWKEQLRLKIPNKRKINNEAIKRCRFERERERFNIGIPKPQKQVKSKQKEKLRVRKLRHRHSHSHSHSLALIVMCFCFFSCMYHSLLPFNYALEKKNIPHQYRAFKFQCRWRLLACFLSFIYSHFSNLIGWKMGKIQTLQHIFSFLEILNA